MNELSVDQKSEGWDPVAEAYDTTVTPFTTLFAEDALRLTNVQPGQRVLDVAAGTGALSFAAAKAGADVLATDFSSGMIDYLRSKVKERGVQGIRVAVMDGQALDGEGNRFDAAFSILGLMFVPDRAAGFRELYRAIKPGGHAAVVCWCAIERVRFMHVVGSALREAVPNLPAPTKPPTHQSLSDRNVFKSEMEAGGFARVNMFTVAHVLTFSSPEALFNSIGGVAPAMAFLFNTLQPKQREAFRTALIQSIRREQGEGPYGLEGEANIAVGVK